jgi:RNA polymerase sigma factor (TIGR02999 family)
VSHENAPLDGSFGALYQELRRIAHAQLRRGDTPTLNTTAVVHEAYIKLSAAGPQFADRTHFLAMAARVMRQVVLDYIRLYAAQKRGGDFRRVTMTEEMPQLEASLEDLLAVNDALELLERTDERLARLVEMRFFAGLSDAEIAAALSLSPRSVSRDWRRARAFLQANLHRGDAL